MERKLKKEIIEWALIISIGGFIYLLGWHTEIIGRLQQFVLYTGVIQPSEVEDERLASYDFYLEDLEGNRLSFDSFKDEVVFVNFWATWCPPCIAEMPDIHSLYDVKKNEVKFVLISLDQDESKAKSFIERKEFDFPVYFLRSSLPKTFDTHAIPTTYVIDRDGYIKVENHGMAKYNSERFRDLLTELSEGK